MAGFAGDDLELQINIVESGIAVYPGFPLSQQIEIGAVEDQYVSHNSKYWC